jgi:hypothetical protein
MMSSPAMIGDRHPLFGIGILSGPFSVSCSTDVVERAT